MTPITREQAIQQGLQHYFTGKPCTRGHIAPRFVSSFGCKECAIEISKKVRQSRGEEEKKVFLEKSRDRKRQVAAVKKKFKDILESERLNSVREKMVSLGLNLPLTRAEAKSIGSKFYFNGDICPRGHVDKRFACSGGCFSCQIENGKKNRSKPEQSPKVLARKRKDYEKNKEKRRATIKAYAIKNRDSVLAKKREYQKNNPHVYRATGSFRRARLRNATPPWITQQMREEIKDFHAEAERREQETGIQFDVDHIVPLDGKIICGLHVPWNLRVITHSDNISRPKHFVDLHLAECKATEIFNLTQTATADVMGD